MKYRVISGSDDLNPFIVERKDETSLFPIWRRVGKFRSLNDAEHTMRRSVERHVKNKIGDIIREFTEEDLVVERLKHGSAKNPIQGSNTSMDVAQQAIVGNR